MPLALIDFESKGMLRDRIYGISNTLFHEPYYQRHLVSSFVMRRDDASSYRVEANYLVCRTKTGALTEVYNAGRVTGSSWPATHCCSRENSPSMTAS